MVEIPFGTDKSKRESFGKQVDRYLAEHASPLGIDTEGERQLKILLGILGGEINASAEELRIVSTLVAKLVPGASPRSTEIKREEPGAYISRAMEKNEGSFAALTEQAIEWAGEAEEKTRSVMEALSGVAK